MFLMKTLILQRNQVAALLDLDTCIAAVESAFKLLGEGKAGAPGVLGVHSHGGGFHIKAGILPLNRNYFAAKINGNFFNNAKLGLPRIQGVIALCDADNGTPLAIMDSIEITILRTGAASAVAVKYLARPDARTVAICGCGIQGRVQLRAIGRVRKIDTAFAWDAEPAIAEQYAADMSKELGILVSPIRDLGEARAADIWITCTPSTNPFLSSDHVAPGSFIAAVGADSEEKHELDPSLVSSSKLVTDVTAQCAAIGELHHALSMGKMALGNVYAELAEVVAASKPGRASDQEMAIFDSTGMALQDVAAAAAVYQQAIQQKIGHEIDFFE